MERKNTIEGQKIEITTIDNVEDILRLYPGVDEKQLEKIRTDVTQDIKKAKGGSRIIYGAKNKEGIIGVVQLVFKDDKEFYADGKTRAHIHHARVAEELRGKGIGSELMRYAEDEAKQRGFKEMTLGVEETNENAIRFYEELGYREFMREKGEEGEVIIGMKKGL